jgi:ribose transport system ATP-binding protein
LTATKGEGGGGRTVAPPPGKRDVAACLNAQEAAACAVRLRGISKSFAVVRALQDVDFELYHGEVVGLIGENGAGKSTLIGVLSGTLRPDAGQYELHGAIAPLGDPGRLAALGVSVVVQEQALVEALRVYENIYLGREDVFRRFGFLQKSKMRAMARQLLEEMGIRDVRVDAVVGNLSFPKRQLIDIAKAFALAQLRNIRPIVLLDEPTSGLSESEIEILFANVDKWRDRAAFVFVSHQLHDVLRVSTRLLVLKDGRVVTTMPNRGITEARLHELMVGRERGVDYYHQREQTSVSSSAPVIELHAASAEPYFKGVNLSVRPGEIVGLAGVVASGKSEVAAALAGAIRLSEGSIAVEGHMPRAWSVPKAIRHGVFYVPPERSTDSIFSTALLRSNISIGFLSLFRLHGTPLLNPFRERAITRDLIQKFSIRPSDASVPIHELSGGNQQKAVFARWNAKKCKVLVVDDPTRGIDVGTREEIYGILRQLVLDGTAIVLCSESLNELIGMSNRIVVLKDARVTAEVAAPAEAKPSEVDIIRHMV